MGGSVLTIKGAVIGAIIVLVTSCFAARSAYQAADNEQQRSFLRQLYVYGGLYAVVHLALVVLASTRAIHYAFLLLGFLMWFLPLGPVMVRVHRRLGELAAGPVM